MEEIKDTYLHTKYLNTWNKEIHKKILKVMIFISENISELVDAKGTIDIEKTINTWKQLGLIDEEWNIICKKVWNKIIEIVTKKEEEKEIKDLESIERHIKVYKNILENLRHFFHINHIISKEIKNFSLYKDIDNHINSKYPNWVNLNIFNLNLILSKCKNIAKCEYALEKYKDKKWENLKLDIFSINTILSKCTQVSECKYVIIKYWEKVDLDIVSYNILLKICLTDKYTNIDEIKEYIQEILKNVNTLSLDENNKNILINYLTRYWYENIKFIFDTVLENKYEKLYFLLKILNDKYLEIFSKSSEIQINKPETVQKIETEKSHHLYEKYKLRLNESKIKELIDLVEKQNLSEDLALSLIKWELKKESRDFKKKNKLIKRKKKW